MGQALYYVTLVSCVGGCSLRILLAGYYRMLLRSMKRMKTTKNKWIVKLKEQFILRYQAMLGVQNVESFVGRFLAERRILGIPVTAWNSLHIQLVSLCLLTGALDALYRCIQGAENKVVLMAMFQGIWTSAVLLLVDGFCMVSGKMDALRELMCDYLENYLKVRLEHEYEVWGKNREDLRQTKAVLEAQLQVIDEKSYKKEKRASLKRKPEVERKVQRDVQMLKREVEAARRMREAEAAVSAELERNTSRQVEEILTGLW